MRQHQTAACKQIIEIDSLHIQLCARNVRAIDAGVHLPVELVDTSQGFGIFASPKSLAFSSS